MHLGNCSQLSNWIKTPDTFSLWLDQIQEYPGRSILFWRGLLFSCLSLSCSGRREGLHKRLAGQEVLQNGHQAEAGCPWRPENSALLVSRTPPSALPPAGWRLRLRPRSRWPPPFDPTPEEDEKRCVVIGSFAQNTKSYLNGETFSLSYRESVLEAKGKKWTKLRSQLSDFYLLHHFCGLMCSCRARWHLWIISSAET